MKGVRRGARAGRVLGTLAVLLPTLATAAEPACSVAPFQGATAAQGATTRMRVVNTGAACHITNFGKPGEKGNPAESGAITTPPSHGSAVFAAPDARYTPAPGYVGADEFAYEAFAAGSKDGHPLRLKVRVQVQVVAP